VAYGAITELVGAAKAAGKSTLVQHMIKAHLDGGSFLGEPCVAGEVLLVTEEDTTTLREALELADLLRPDLHTLQWPNVWSKPWQELSRDLRKAIKEIGVKLVIIDTFPQFAPESEADSESGLEALRPVRMIAHDGVAVILIRHERKAGGGVGKSGRGTSAIPGGVDIMLHLKRRAAKASNTRALTALSRFRATPEETIIELTDKGYVRVDKGAAELNASKVKVLAILNGEYRSTQEILDATKMTRSTVQRALVDLLASGAIVKSGIGSRTSPLVYKKMPDIELKKKKNKISIDAKSAV